MVCCHHLKKIGKVKKKEYVGGTDLLSLLKLLTAGSASLLLALALLEEGLGDENLVLGGDSAVKVSIVCPKTKCKTSPSARIAAIAPHSPTEGN
jgi:hypothetical protein